MSTTFALCTRTIPLMLIARSVCKHFHSEGRFALSSGSELSYLAFSTDIVMGRVTLYNLLTYTQEKEIAAHNSPVVFMTFNERGNLLATLSCNVYFVIIF